MFKISVALLSILLNSIFGISKLNQPFVGVKKELKKENIVLENEYFCSDYEAGEYYRDIFPTNESKVISNSFYFENLHGRHGLNDCDICTVISAQILLGYYDTFLNDQIVDELYDEISSQYVSSLLIQDFGLSPGTGRLYSNDRDDRFRDILIENMISGCNHNPINHGASTSNQISMLDSYLSSRGIEYSALHTNDPLISTIDSDTMDIIKNAIDNDRPVIANGKKHSVVAYGYDANFVYVATGWGYVAATPWSTFHFDILSPTLFTGAIDLILHCDHFHSDNYFCTNTEDYLCPCGTTLHKTTINPEDYGFEQQYFFYEKTKTICIGELYFETKRLRTGFIENEFINLSPRRSGAGFAYLEYTFPFDVRTISFHISFWSEFENPSNGYAFVQHLDQQGIWTQSLNLYTDIYLPTDRFEQNYVTINFPQSVKTFRFAVSNDAVGTKNKGRISLTDLEVIYG